jgi:two-component system nitrate/nitrite response regulator NarL
MKFLVVDDHPVLRDGLAALIGQVGNDTHVLQARDAAEAFDLLDQNEDVELVIVDLLMPGMDGLAAIGEFGRKRPEMPVIVLSSSEDPQDARRALAEGALGYVPKSANPNTLLAAIKLVLNGELYVPALILNDSGADPQRSRTVDPRLQTPLLTERQVDVLRLVSEGQSNKAIAHALDLSENTVKVHISAVFKALQVVNRTQAARAGRERGMI